MKKLRSNGRIHRGVDISFSDEPLFKRMLTLECRRAERSGSPFALALFDVDQLETATGADILEQVATGLAATVRETDIAGWYRQACTVGIILTAVNETDRSTLEAIISERAHKALSSRLTPVQMARIRISFHFFPQSDAGNYDEPDSLFFSDEGNNGSIRPSRASLKLKRMVDVVGSLAALFLLSPVFVAIAVLIKATSRGPVFFRQTRIGQFGRSFTFLKFRSMYVNNDPTIHKEYIRSLIDKKVTALSGTFKIKNDPRVTKLGRFLRKSSLDELPQFINVLRGEMSLVGPRPPIPYEFESYSLWHRRRILEARPGITGEWQVHGRSRTTFDEMVRMDLRYIRNQSTWLDLKILLKTPLAVLTGNGAY